MAPRRLMLRVGICLVVVAGVDPARALAQGGQSGSIVGSVFDSGGTPLRGVKVSASSETQIGGARVAYSNEEGFFRLPGPGAGGVSAAGHRAPAEDHRGQGRARGHQRAGGGQPGARGGERHRGSGGGGAGAPHQHQHGQRARGVRPGDGGGPAPRQPGQRPLPGGQRRGGRHQRTHPRRRGQPDHLHAGRLRHPRAGAHAEDVGGLRGEHRRLRRGQPDGLGRVDQHGHQVRIEPPRVRVQRHRRHQLAAASSPTAWTHRTRPSCTSSTRWSPAPSSRTSSGSCSTPRSTSSRSGGTATWRATSPTHRHLPQVGAQGDRSSSPGR